MTTLYDAHTHLPMDGHMTPALAATQGKVVYAYRGRHTKVWFRARGKPKGVEVWAVYVLGPGEGPV